jgi:hypothetical protein
VSQLYFIDENNQFIKKYKTKETQKEGDVTHYIFSKAQKACLIWNPIIALLVYSPVYFNYQPELHVKFKIIAIGFCIIPIIVLHIPDYLICLFIWYYQRNKLMTIVKKKNHRLTQYYENTILFKHEMLYFQLPGLHKIFVKSVKNNAMSIENAIEKIDYLYWLTFQQKQAQKAILALGKDRIIAHEFIHYLIRKENTPLLKALSQKNRLAGLYLMLEVPEGIVNKLRYVSNEMKKEKDLQYNDEFIQSLYIAYNMLTANQFADLLKQCASLPDLPKTIPYFQQLNLVFSDISERYHRLIKIDDIDRFETKRQLLSEQKKELSQLAEKVATEFYSPFDTIWQQTLNHFAQLIENEIALIQGSADLSIALINQKLFASNQKNELYFEIMNTGQELADDVQVHIQKDELFELSQEKIPPINIIETDTKKEISISIIASQPGETIVKGKIIYSDKSAKEKAEAFSFPLLISKKERTFVPIENPYNAGNPIAGDAVHLYRGRQDAYDFIDQNILVKGNRHTIVCHGLRRTGKTSLLYRIVEKGFSDKRIAAVYLDIQGVYDEKDFYLSLSDGINKALEMDHTPEINHFGDFKRFVKTLKTEKIIALLIDEFEELQMRVESNKMDKSVFSNIRHLMQHEPKLLFVFCGTHKLEEMAADYWSIFFNTALYLKINFLNKENTIQLITEPVSNQLTYDELAIEHIYKLTHGQPYLTQLICHTLVSDLNDNQKRNYANINDVDTAVDEIISSGSDNFSKSIWESTKPTEHLVLSTLAQLLTHKRLEDIGPEPIYQKISEISKTLPRQAYIKALDRLVTMDVLFDRNARYGFTVALFRNWVYKRNPLEKVRAEIGSV